MDIEDGPSQLEGFALHMNSYFVGPRVAFFLLALAPVLRGSIC
jgi:hypothetical protein